MRVFAGTTEACRSYGSPANLSAAKSVGAGRFERPTARTPSVCATRLRYAPIKEK